MRTHQSTVMWPVQILIRVLYILLMAKVEKMGFANPFPS